MNNENVEAFYREVAQVMHRHDVRTLVGMWFAGTADNYGFMTLYDIADTGMKDVAFHLQGKFEEWEKTIVKPETLGNIHSVEGPANEQN